VTKAEGDLAVQQMISDDGLPAVIVRPGTFFGPGDRLNFGRIADRLRAGRAIVIGRGDNAIPWVYVTNLIQGLLLALDHPAALGRAPARADKAQV
jgi:nucleoside-diphosphate-sugar epimerase